jgi:hypothetical protein
LLPIRTEARERDAASLNQDFGAGFVDSLFEEFPGAVAVGDKEDRLAVGRPGPGKILVGVEYQAARLAPLAGSGILIGEEWNSRNLLAVGQVVPVLTQVAANTGTRRTSNEASTIKAMYRRSTLFFSAVLVLCGLFLGLASFAQDSSHRGRKYKAPPPTSKIEVTVLRDKDGKPIENAAVIFHTLNEKGNMELKSNEDGKALIDVLEIGETVRLQIIAKGFQTFGNDYKIDKDQMAIEVRMKRPGEQYSIYKPHPENSENQDKPKGDKPNQ